jgi:hypothetical protein
VGAAVAGRMDLLGSSLRRPRARLESVLEILTDVSAGRRKILPWTTGAPRRMPCAPHRKARWIQGKPTDRGPWAPTLSLSVMNSLRPLRPPVQKQFLFSRRTWIQFQDFKSWNMRSQRAQRKFADHERGFPAGAIAKSSQVAQCWDGTTSPDTGEFVPLSQCRSPPPHVIGATRHFLLIGRRV